MNIWHADPERGCGLMMLAGLALVATVVLGILALVIGPVLAR